MKKILKIMAFAAISAVILSNLNVVRVQGAELRPDFFMGSPDGHPIRGLAYYSGNYWIATSASGGRGPSFIHKADQNGTVTATYNISPINRYINGVSIDDAGILFSFDQYNDILMKHTSVITSTSARISQSASGLSNGPRTLAYGLNSLWAVSNSSEIQLWEIDPNTLRVIKTYLRPELTGLCWGGGKLHGLSPDGYLQEMELTDSSCIVKKSRKILGVNSVAHLTFDGTSFLFLNYDDNKIYKITPGTCAYIDAIKTSAKDFGKCNPRNLGIKSALWGEFGRREILEFSSGETLYIVCAAHPSNPDLKWQFQLWYTKPTRPGTNSESYKIGSCPYGGGNNTLDFWYCGDEDGDDKPDALIRTTWTSRDYHIPDPFDNWLMIDGDYLLDWAISDFWTSGYQLFKYAEKYEVASIYKNPLFGYVIPNNPSPAPENGKLPSIAVPDPILGPETEAFFDDIFRNLGPLSLEDTMVEYLLPSCDFDGDGDCDSTDEFIFAGMIGSCLGDLDYRFIADYDGDGCITISDKDNLFSKNRVFEVSIDIKPGSYPNSISLKSKGVIPVAILTTSEFNALKVEPGTVLFAGASPIKWTAEDVNGDGAVDKIFFFKTQDIRLNKESTEAILNGITTDGKHIWGRNLVKIVP